MEPIKPEWCPECEHAPHGVEYGLQADDCTQVGCTCGEAAREAEWLAHNPTAA